VLVSRSLEAREFAAAVVSALARTQGGNKKMIYQAGGVEALVSTLGDGRVLTQKHAACALWGLSDGKDGVYDRQIAEAGAIPHLTKLLINGDQETCGFAAACLLCLCRDRSAHSAILSSGAVEPLQALVSGPASWLRAQCHEMLTLLRVPVPNADGTFTEHSSSGSAAAATAPSTELVPRPGLFVARNKLKLRSAAELDSVDSGYLPAGTQVTIVDRRELADGTKRASVARDGESRPLGWVSSIGKDGDDNLLRSEDPAATEAILAASESFAVRHPLNEKGTARSPASARSPSARASSRIYLPLVSPTTKGKFHFFSFQINATWQH